MPAMPSSASPGISCRGNSACVQYSLMIGWTSVSMNVADPVQQRPVLVVEQRLQVVEVGGHGRG